MAQQAARAPLPALPEICSRLWEAMEEVWAPRQTEHEEERLVQ